MNGQRREAASREILDRYNVEDCQALRSRLPAPFHCLAIQLPKRGKFPAMTLLNGRPKVRAPVRFQTEHVCLPGIRCNQQSGLLGLPERQIYVNDQDQSKQSASTLVPDRRTQAASNNIVQCAATRSCPKCGLAQLLQARESQSDYDRSQIHEVRNQGWVTLYRFHRYQCQNCGAVFHPEGDVWGKSQVRYPKSGPMLSTSISSCDYHR